MKNMKNLITTIVLAVGAIGGDALAGNVWEFIHVSDKDSSYVAGETIQFKMRLLAPNYEDAAEDRTAWAVWPNMDNAVVASYYLQDPTHAAENLNALYPLQIGIVANGQTYGAKLVGTPASVDSNMGTDFTFEYSVKCGDYALPLRLAADADGTPINVGTWKDPLASETGTRYYFLNGPGDANDIWNIQNTYTDAGGSAVTVQFDRQLIGGTEAQKSILAREETYVSTGDYLRTFAYRLETLEYDDTVTQGDDGEECWRVIRGSAGQPKEPTLRTVNDREITEAGQTVYAWVAPGGGDDDDPSTWSWGDESGYAVTIPSGKGVTTESFFDPDQDKSSDTPRTHRVYTFTLTQGSALPYTFTLKGQNVGARARVILSSSKHWNYYSSGSMAADYRLKTVYCGEQKPTLSVTLDNYESPASFPSSDHAMTDYTKAERLRVSLEGVDTHPAFRVKLGFDLNGDTAFPTNVIAISTDKAAGFLTKNLLNGMEVTFAENATEATESLEGLYLFVLGATTNTLVSPGIQICPYPQSGAPAVEATNSLYVVIKGMNPVVTKPVGTAESPAPDIIIRGGGEKEVEVNLVDSYRNLNLSSAEASNGCYKVVWTPGNGLANQIITNDVNGLPLKPDSYGQLSFKVTYPKNDATNLASFYVVNPEGLKSYWEDDDGKQYAESYVRVVVTRPATATAAFSSDGEEGDTFDEGLTLDVAFSIDQPDLQSRDLYAFLQPCNEAASNRCEASFITEDKNGKKGDKGILLWNQKGSTDDTTGGLKLLDGPGNPQPKFRVVLCTAPTYDPDKVVTDYETTELLLKILNVQPRALQLKMEDSSRYIRSSGATTDVVRINVERDFTVRSYEDVTNDLEAAGKDQIVLRWRLYEIEDGDENVEPNEVVYTIGKDSAYTMPGLETTGMKKIVLQVQDKDMRPKGEVKEDAGEPGGWKYVMDKEDAEHDWWEDDENQWGPEFVVYVPVSDKPTVNVTAVGGLETLGGLQVFSESQLPPFSAIADPDMGFLVTLSEGYKSGALRVKLELQYQDKAKTGVATNGYVTVGVTNLVFNKNSTTSGSRVKNVSITDFDGTWRDDLKRQGYAVWRLLATVYDPAAAKEEIATGYEHGECDFYVRNDAPIVSPESKYVDCLEVGGALEVAKNGTVTIGYTVEDIESDLTNGMQVVCSVKGGEVIGEATHLATNGMSVASGDFSVRFTSSGTNSVIITATDKDHDSSSIRLYFYTEATRNLLLYPAKPTTPSTDSDDIADYFSAAGIGYGRVWASSQLSGIQYWIHTWTSPGSAEAVLAYAKGYAAGETEVRSNTGYPAFVDVDGNDSDASKTASGYSTPLKNLDSFFYRWFAKIASDTSTSGSWTAYKPVPQLSTNTAIVAAQTVISLAFPKSTGNSSTVVYNDISAVAIFSREYLWSDNMGDINRDGVPDSYVVKYKLTDGDYTEGNDLTDVNYSSDGTTPSCLDYLPTTSLIKYSELVEAAGATSSDDSESVMVADNIKNAVAFTPRKKLRGYDEGLNDATAETFPDGVSNQAFVDGAKPEKVYECADGSYNAATCTVSRLEYLAWQAYKAAHPGATFDSWSPERPTDPTKADTDNDGFTDGYEYYWWYRAHVGYLTTETDGTVVRRTVTGRRYDPRNPGEGTFISSETIARLMDPIQAFSESTQDTDNDGLPDLIEFELGTNPFDFDSDADGLPDGFEIMLAGTDATTGFTTQGISDAMRNYDGDAMAFTTPALEASVQPAPFHTDVPYSFALVDADGDSDGIQWYVSGTEPTGLATNGAVAGTSFVADGVTYVTTDDILIVGGRLAVDLPRESTWTVTNAIEGVFDAQDGEVVALMPTRIPAGTLLSKTNAVTAHSVVLTNAVADANAAWLYGRQPAVLETTGDSLANLGGFGMLAVGRYKPAPAKVRLAALPKADQSVAYLHYLVYQKFGFDPRTAWNANTPLAARWGSTSTSGGETETVANKVKAGTGYAGIATRTREFTLYDEFLVYSFFINNGMTDITLTVLDNATTQIEIWYANTTNPQGPQEPDIDFTTKTTSSGSVEYVGRNSDNGADTDGDGVPDGWELYVMAGPKNEKTGRFHFAMPYNDGVYSSFGPFVADAASKSQTDNDAVNADGSVAGDNDDLTELQEYAGTDSCAYYSGLNQTSADTESGEGSTYAYSTTIVRPDEHKTWFNKFFPTDPWNEDTDGDGLTDNEIANQQGGVFKCASFCYGDVDTGKTAVPGGGLNPCTIDTDFDGLPDGWEAQFAGSTIYGGEDRTMASGTDADGNEATSASAPLQGLCDGMDGTVFDAYNFPRINCTTTTEAKDYRVILNGVDQVVDRDYDHDGLSNWQEYLTGAMRCWRYDDPFGWWEKYIPESSFFDTFGNFLLDTAMDYLEKQGAKFESEDDFWYETLFNRGGKWYNPHFVTGTSPANEYFSRVRNGWDPNFTDAGAYYILFDRVNDALYKDTWGYMAAPLKYISTSPIVADTDKDGMDDGYELFHGMNPILGSAGVLLSSEGPCDVVYDAWYVDPAGSPAGDAENNVWSDRGYGLYDFVAQPWLNGVVDADPDGDDIRNQDEAIMPMVAPSTTWTHTDPTPLWMTDASYDKSLARLYFRLPVCPGTVTLPAKDSIEHDGETYYFRDCDGYALTLAGPVLLPFTPDFWSLTGTGTMNWMYSFEENEGYDTDHDAAGDSEELSGKFRSATDPQDANSPRRRQAMYFQGPENPSALQSMPFAAERYPRAAMGYPDDMSLLQYTVECWVRPESAADATVIERAVYTSPSHWADEMYVRCNFRIALKDGKWYTKFDANGTLAETPVEVIGATAAAVGEWTYVAATYDAKKLTLYVNGEVDGVVESSLKPTYGSSAVVVYPGESGTSVTNGSGSLEAMAGDPDTYWFDSEYSVHAFLVGASFRTDTEPGVKKSHLNVLNAKGWDFYRDFFKGYVDEIRVWDGALSADTIANAHYAQRKRYSRTDAIENRSTVYSEWTQGKTRYNKDGDGTDYTVEPELRFHWGFDSVPGAENAAQVAVSPRGFATGSKVSNSRPDGYVIPWWDAIVGSYGSVYAGLRNWVTWIPNTVAHLPRFDTTTLDSAYWSENYAGDTAGTYKFARTAEPVSLWTQMIRNGTDESTEFQTTDRRFWLANNTGTNATSTLSKQFEFTARHLNQSGDDLLPLGGAFVKYVDRMWDDGTASETWDHTDTDADGDGLPDWWQTYAEQNYREGLDPETEISWNTSILYTRNGVKTWMKASQAYLYDLANGIYVDAKGEVHAGPTVYAQTHATDGRIPDWWKKLMKIDDEEPLADTDNDGLSNYAEYLASEELSFGVTLDPKRAKTDTATLDYFRTFGRLYLGEMLTDHDQMEDHWERSLGDTTVADASLWDATKDADEDGWDNFAENRYNGYAMSTLAQLVSHAMGDNEVLDAPTPSVKLTVRYNGSNFSAAGSDGQQQTSGSSSESTETSSTLPNLVVRTYTKDTPAAADATFTMQPGTSVDREVYLGGWEDRVVRGTMAPGNVDLGSVNLMFAQVPQSDLYSWTDESGLHLSRPYSEFKEALEKNPDIIQNVQSFEWLELTAPVNEYTSSDKAVTVTRDKLTQVGYIAVYGEHVGTIDLTTGDFEFDMAAMNELAVNYTFSDSVAGAWSYKEAIFKISYSAKIPSLQANKMQVSLGKADTGFVKGGKNTIVAFFDNDKNGEYTPGEPFGVLNGVDIGWAGRDVEIELTDMSAVTPRVELWGSSGGNGAQGGQAQGGQAQAGGAEANTASSADASASDRGVRVGTATFTDGNYRFETATAPADVSRVRVVRYKVDDFNVYTVGVDAGVVLDKTFDQDVRSYLHEGDFLSDGKLDIDWDDLYTDVVNWIGVQMAGCDVTNVTYLIVYNWDNDSYESDTDTNKVVRASSTLVTRRFERTRRVPTPCPERAVCNRAQPTFAWKIENEDTWASWFGTTYTAFKVRVRDEAGALVYDSGIRRLPAKDTSGVYSWTAPLYVGSVAPGTGVAFENLTTYTWEVALYNAKFKTDTLVAMEHLGNPFSKPETFRMNVTTADASSEKLAVRVCYGGPATDLAGKVRVQAFESPDFTGDPLAELTLDGVDLASSGTEANATLTGLASGSYFLRAYIDTNGNFVRDDWESWGYLSERDRADTTGIFNPIALATAANPNTAGARKLFIEDCDTDGDWFPDVWEAEQNGNVFSRTKIGPVTGNAELIGVNTNLVSHLDDIPALAMLATANGFALASGVSPAKVSTAKLADGSTGFTVDNRVESVEIASLGFDSNGDVVISVEGSTAAATTVGLSSFYSVASAAVKTVTCRVYAKADLASEWGSPVAEETVTVGAGAATLTVDRTKVSGTSAFFKVEVVE